jgi:nucleoside 2-deoxyribosyltransferase
MDEGSWIYLSAGPAEDPSDRSLREELAEACAKSGWAAVSHPPPEGTGAATDPGRFFASVSHAVEHADVVVAVIDGRSEMSDAELTLAYSHGRPIVGVQIGEGPLGSEARMSLSQYDRARIVACDTPEQCAASLGEVLSDPVFAETIRQAG